MKMLLKPQRIIDVENNSSLEGAEILISNGIIEAIGKKEDFENLDVETWDFPECTLLPGLIDAHVHLTLMGSLDPWSEMVQDSVEIAVIKATVNARKTIESGVTTVRDLGSRNGVCIEIVNSINKGLIEGPRVIASGLLICMTGGHGYPLGVEVDGRDSARKAARQEIKRGAKVIKVMATGGVITPGVEPGAPQLTVEELEAVVEESHKAGRKVAAHAHGTEGIKNALLSGCDTIEHCSYLDDSTIKLLKDTNAFMVSTLVATKNPMEDLENPNMPEYLVRKLKKHSIHESQSLRDAIHQGVNLAVGTDAGAVLTPHNQMPKQLQILVKHGMTCQQAIRTGTLQSALALGIGDETGSLEIGKYADILIVSGNPIDRIEDLNNIIAVMKDGKFFVNHMKKLEENRN